MLVFFCDICIINSSERGTEEKVATIAFRLYKCSFNKCKVSRFIEFPRRFFDVITIVCYNTMSQAVGLYIRRNELNKKIRTEAGAIIRE